MSALPPNADMCGATRDVRFGPIADISAHGGQALDFASARFSNFTMFYNFVRRAFMATLAKGAVGKQ